MRRLSKGQLAAGLRQVHEPGGAPDADVAGQLAIRALLHAEVDKGVLAEHTLGIQVSGQEAAVAG